MSTRVRTGPNQEWRTRTEELDEEVPKHRSKLISDLLERIRRINELSTLADCTYPWMDCKVLETKFAVFTFDILFHIIYNDMRLSTKRNHDDYHKKMGDPTLP